MMLIRLLVCCSVAMGLMQEPAVRPPNAVDVAELSRLERVWNEAHIGGDADALDRLWADGLVVTVPEMPMMTRPEVISMSRSGRMQFQRYSTSDLRIRLYGDAAVVTGRLQRTRTLAGQSVADDWQFTKMYVRHAHSWQVVAFHASMFAR